MPFDGNGNWSSTFSAVADRDANIKILASRFDNIFIDDIKNSFDNCITRDGQGKTLANFNANNYKVINVADPTSNQDATNKKYVDENFRRIVGQIIQVACTSDYIPDGCLPCDGAEYSKTQFNDLWTNFLNSSPAKLLTCSYEDYQTDITTYGQCAKFAVDTTNNKFKVPTIKDGSYITQAKSNSELGKSYNESLPNITGTFGGIQNGATISGAFSKTSNITANYYYDASNACNYNFSAHNSNSIYQNNAKVQGDNIRMRFFVVVSNGQINQASMDWSQWATSLAGRLDTNASNATATGKSTIVGWGMPDYSAGIDISGYTSSSNQFTAPKDGLISICINSYMDNKVYINNTARGFANNNDSYARASITLPMSRGETFYAPSVLNQTNFVSSFYPYKGE